MTDGTNKKYSSLKRRYGGLDLFRVISALMICMFHTTIHLGCNYGILQGVSRMGAVFMTAFFMLSGFSLFVNWGGISLTTNEAIVKFWKKRVLGIMPIYWFTAFLYVVLMIALKRDTVLQTIALAPIEAFGLQSVFHSLFGYSHNGGTWFISCILICYALYPYLQELIKHFSIHTRRIILNFCTVILLYAPFIPYLFNTERIYSNPFFRLLEFMIGILLASFIPDLEEAHFSRVFKWWSLLLVTIIMAIGITIAVNMQIRIGDYMLYSWICLPCFMFILIGLASIDSVVVNQSKALKWMAGASYSFFLAQLFSNTFCKAIINHFHIESNLLKIALGWGSCIVIAACIHFVELKINHHFIKK